MAKSVLNLPARRFRAILLTVIVAALMIAWLSAHTRSLGNTAHLSGWMLLLTVGFLAKYNARKKVTYPPMLRSSTWLQMHIYVGLLSIVLFLFHILHTGFRLPNGALETTLAILFVTVAGSGIVGLFLSRTLPKRLAVRGQEVLFERIPMFRRELRERAERLVVDSADETHHNTLSDFYTRRLVGFFAGPRHFWGHLLQSSRPLHSLVGELRSLQRYLNPEEQRVAGELVTIVEAKDGLDYHRAMQALLKGWLFVHIPLTFILILIGLAHAVLAMAFSSGSS